MRSDLARAAPAMLLCLALFWPGLMAWFQLDDFAWLRLDHSVERPSDLPGALFAPMAQGTIRPLGDRAFFLIFKSLFGFRALPYHTWVVLTQFVNLLLLAWIARRLTGSRVAGVLAPVFWTANPALAVPLSWVSAYNQVLCGFFLLAAFACLLRFIDTGERRWWRAQWAAFLIGFGALELNAVYPALAAAYTLCCARPHFRRTLPMFAVSAAYALVHLGAAPVRSAGSAYAAHFDASIPATLWTYWQWALGAARLPEFLPGFPEWAAALGTAMLTIALGAFAVARVRKGQWLGLFLMAWFLILILPVLPLRNHLSDYYLTLPTISVALLAAWAAAWALSAKRAWKPVAVLGAGAFLATGGLQARVGCELMSQRSLEARNLVLGVVQARGLHPEKAIALSGIERPLFRAAIAHNAFQAVGLADVHLAPDTAAAIGDVPAGLVIPESLLMRKLAEGRAVVYEPEPRRLRAVTLAYFIERKPAWNPEEPRWVDAGKPSFAGQLGPSWHELHRDHRWMPKRATVRLGGPRSREEKLYISGYCPAAQLGKGPLAVAIALDGSRLGEAIISRGDAPFEFVLPLPADAVGKPGIEVSIEVERTISVSPDRRELGLVFGTFEVRP